MRRFVLLSAVVAVLCLGPAGLVLAGTVVSNSGVPPPLIATNVAFCGGAGAGGSATHLNGPGTPPLGAGSLQLQSGAAPNAFAVGQSFSNMAASSLTAFKVAHYEPAGTASGSVSMEIDALATSSAQTTDHLFLQPQPTDGAWEAVDLVSASTTLTLVSGGSPTPTTYAQYVQNNPDAVVYSVAVFDKTCNTTNQVAYIDKLVIGVEGVSTTYDFEAPKAKLVPSESASTITAGQGVTVGVSAVLATDATPINGQRVKLYARTYPSKQFHLVTTMVTDADGTASTVLHPVVATTYKWTMPPDAYAPVTSATRSVRVRTALTAHVKDTTLSRTQPLVLKGSTYKHRPGATVQLRRTTSTGSTLVQTRTVASDGTFRFKHTLPIGKQHVSVRIGSGSGELANSSSTVTVTVSR